MLCKFILAIFLLTSLSIYAEAAQRKRYKAPELTEQQKHDEYCRSYDLSWIETPQEKAAYYKECAPRVGRVQRFWESVEEMEKRRLESHRAWQAAVKDPKNKRKGIAMEIAGVKAGTSRSTMRGMYQCLYELERREVFNSNGAKRMRAVLERDGAKIGKLTVRQRFARWFIHIGPQETDGYDSLSDEAHRADREYEQALAKRGLVVDCAS